MKSESVKPHGTGPRGIAPAALAVVTALVLIMHDIVIFWNNL